MFVFFLFFFDKKIRKESIWEIQWEKVLSLLLSSSPLAPEWVTGVKRDAKLPPVISSQHAPVVTSVPSFPGLPRFRTHKKKHSFLSVTLHRVAAALIRVTVDGVTSTASSLWGRVPVSSLLLLSLTRGNKFRPLLFISTMEKEPKNTVVKYIATLISSLLKGCSSEAEESSVF